MEFIKGDFWGDFIKEDLDGHINFDLRGRYANNIADQSRALFQLYDGHCIRNFFFETLVVHSVVHAKGENLPLSTCLHPLPIGTQAFWAQNAWREPIRTTFVAQR